MEDVHLLVRPRITFGTTFSSVNKVSPVIQKTPAVTVFVCLCFIPLSHGSDDSVYQSMDGVCFRHPFRPLGPNRSGSERLRVAERAYFGTLPDFWLWKHQYKRAGPHQTEPQCSGKQGCIPIGLLGPSFPIGYLMNPI